MIGEYILKIKVSNKVIYEKTSYSSNDKNYENNNSVDSSLVTSHNNSS